jgi:hypothetical protein
VNFDNTSSNPLGDRLWHTEDLAKWWGLRAETLKNWRSAGRGPAHIKIGSAVRYRWDDILEFEGSNRADLARVRGGR